MRLPTFCCVTITLYLSTLSACKSEDPARCGAGTELIAGECLPLLDASVTDAHVVVSEALPVATCGEHAFESDGGCYGVQSVGAACTRGAECDTQTCMPESEGFPGGYCSIPSCNDQRPCTLGSHCVYSSKHDISVCLVFCSGATECRDGYVCQPLYDGNISVCAPACSDDADCPDQARCDATSGECVLRECDPTQPDGCSDKRVCYPDPRGITTQGGLCLTVCDPSNAECQDQDVCQPLAEDPDHKGVCAPPVCQQTSDCPAFAVCRDHVCLPSDAYPGAPCTGEAGDTCADAHLGAGKQAKLLCKATRCLLDCGSDAIGGDEADAYCSNVDDSLHCVTAAYPDAAVCLPDGSYPGGPCAGDTCGDFAGRAMLCADGRCVVSCTPDDPTTADNEDSCGVVAPTLTCARGVLAEAVCLPTGSFPGSPCAGPNRDACAQDLNGVAELDLQCVNGACAIGCDESARWAGYGDALCSFADPTLTCAQAAGSVCVSACSDGACPPGYACVDPGAVPEHENACLPGAPSM